MPTEWKNGFREYWVQGYSRRIAMNFTKGKFKLQYVSYIPFSLFRPALFANHDLDVPNIAATQNSPPIDLLGEICGGGLTLLKKIK